MTKSKVPVRFSGQHFTIDSALIKDAIKHAKLTPQDIVLDIGAGKGFITVHLLRNARRVIAIEKDIALARHLRRRFSFSTSVDIIACDFQKFAIPQTPFKVVSNIPFGITSEILRILMFDKIETFSGGSIILQLESARKLFSEKIFNPLLVVYKTFYSITLLYKIPPESFMPPPTVSCALLKIQRITPALEYELKDKYLAFVSLLLRKPEQKVSRALKTLFRKTQIRLISRKFGINLNNQIVCLTADQWKHCFLEMLRVVPDKFHPAQLDLQSPDFAERKNKVPRIPTSDREYRTI